MNNALAAIAVAIAGSVAAGCVLLEPAQASSVMTVDERDACKAKSQTHLIGKKLSDPSVPPKSSTVRHIRPADAVTEDFRVERLNIYVTNDDVIETINCG